MHGSNRRFSKEKLHLIFDISLRFKAILATSEVVGGGIVYVATRQYFLCFVMCVTKYKFAEDPKDLVASKPPSARSTASCLHGNHGDLLACPRLDQALAYRRFDTQKPWYYPASIIVFGSFIKYQHYRYSFTRPFMLLLVTSLDLLSLLPLRGMNTFEKSAGPDAPSRNALNGRSFVRALH